MKVLLTAINAKYIHSNLAVYSLRAYAGKYAQQTEIAEYTINQTMDDILSDIYRKKPDILCLSCYLWNILYVEQLITEIHKVLPKMQIWLGGPEVSYNAVSVMEQYPQVTGVMCGEGEETFLELMEYWNQERESLDTIKGIVYRENGTCRQNPPRPVMDLSKVPFVYDHIEDFQNKIIYYESSRGCPFSCSYCLSSIDKCLRFRNLELVKKELQFFIDHEVPQVKFVDRTFNCKHSHSMAIWTYLKEHDRGKTNFHFEVAADLLNEEEMELIASMRPGLIQLEIGIQSANPKTIREIHRTMDLKKVRAKVERIREKGNVHQHLDLIAGLPYENYESFGHSFNEVYAMHPDQLQLGFLKVLHGSFMYDNAEAYGLVWQERPPYEVLSTKWLPYGDVIRLKKVEEMVEVHYNSGQFANTMEHLVKEFPSPFDLYVELGEYYEKNGLFGINHSRLARYENLWQFIRTQIPDRADSYREWLTLDLYLRENVKNRPAFAGENQVTKEEMTAFYREEAETHRYLKEYDGFDARQLRKMTHLEKINGKYLLFDYRNRSRLSQNAATYEVCFSNE